METKKYGLFTAVSMIVGIVIGSGIFFKSDDVLTLTNGSVFLGVVVFAIAAMSIIFGSLTVAELASRTDDVGGAISYASIFISKKVGCAFGWFQTFIYFPTIIAVVSWVSGVYMCILFGIEGTLENQMLIGLIVIFILYLINGLSAKIGGKFQTSSTIIKLIPLAVIAVLGIIFGDTSSLANIDTNTLVTTSWIAAIAPTAYAFDGWIISTSISHEIKNTKKNLPFALIIGSITVFIIYVLYFMGVSFLVGPEKIIELGDAHVNVAAQILFGSMGAKLIMIFVVISVIGTVNGIIMGGIRLPNTLATRSMVPFSNKLLNINKKTGVSTNSVWFMFTLTIGWYIIHYITQKFGVIPHSDISEISIVSGYVLYILLYFKVFKMGIGGEVKGIFRGKINPILATIGSFIILYGGMKNPFFFYFVSICLAIIIISIIYYNKVTLKTQKNN